MLAKLLTAATVLTMVAGGAWVYADTLDQSGKGPSAEALKHVGAALLKAYAFEPFQPPMPDHLWYKFADGPAIFVHFSKPVTDPKATVIFVGEGIKGRFCLENQPDGGKTGFIHFHRLRAPEGAKGVAVHGHGGNPGEEGYWLKHIAVAEFDMMGMHFKPGVAMNFMPTPAPKC